MDTLRDGSFRWTPTEVRSFIIFFLVLAFSTSLKAAIYVSTSGNDATNKGTIDQPFATIPKAVSVAVPGDTIYVRGGTYTYSTTISISKSGTDSSRYYLFAYPGERPVLDFSPMAISGSNRGIKLSGRYWYVKGFDIYRAGDNGMIINGGSYNIIEFCSFYENSDTGLQLANGASYNQIINCDSYYNRDPDQGNADGFSPKLDVGTGNYFYGCRSWQNSDDGFDGYLRPADTVRTTLENCWSFMNGYLKDGTMGTGNGNGFKMGGGDNGNADSLRHRMTLKRCLAFDNKVKGFDQNNNRGSMTLLNCTGYRNGSYDYSISGAIKSGETLTLANCVEFGNKLSIAPFAILITDSWMPPFVVEASDFESLDTTGVRGPRKADGSLPDVAFMHLVAGSDLIDAGTNVGLPYNGAAPDLGCFETGGISSVVAESARPHTFELGQNYPNPFNPSTNITFSVDKTAKVTLDVLNLLGQKVLTLFDDVAEAGTSYKATFHAGNLSSGVYFYRFQSGMTSKTKKLILLK